ncbi:MAG: Lhr-like helicase [Gammaproteobacteria bacterium]|jgi:Lhr-like helicase
MVRPGSRRANPSATKGLGSYRIGVHSLLVAPTGSGKTLAAFFGAIDRTTSLPVDAPPGVGVVYVPPLKALLYDVEHNLRAPLRGIQRTAGVPDVGPDVPTVLTHHGSVSHEQRAKMEHDLECGALRGIVTTSSLELRIDMGNVDTVIQIESPGSVARGLQRIGRSRHQVGARSIRRIILKFKGDLLKCAVIGQRIAQGLLEAIAVPTSPLHVLAQQVIAICCDALKRRNHSRPWPVWRVPWRGRPPSWRTRRRNSVRTRPSDRSILGASTCAVESIGRDRVMVLPRAIHLTERYLKHPVTAPTPKG